MMLKEDKDKMTDLAWNRLYERLEQDGLLIDTPQPEKKKLYSYKALKWVAAVAVLCISISMIYIINNSNVENATMLTLQNEEAASTLVKTLEDGSVVYLSGYASLNYPEHFRDEKREVSLDGDAFFDINRNPHKPFIIDTKDAIIEVLGTSFNVKSIGEAPFSLSVETGEVRVTSKRDNKVLNVRAGETAFFQAESLHKVKTDSNRLFSTYKEKIHFKDESLSNIIQIINMNSGSVKLSLSSDIENRKLTVTFQGNSPSDMAELISIALNLELTRNDNIITLSKK
ncbi:MAG: FecR family protein [Dysgonomonas sp.]|nr:FecR family protein [Dysgonomonas sp.]